MSENYYCGFINPKECRELLIRIDERVADLHRVVKGTEAKPGLEDRVDSLEQERDEKKGQVKALAILGGGGGIIGILTFVYHLFMRKP